MSRRASSCAVIGGALIAYFIVFPDDLGFAGRLLALTQSVSIGAWALLIAIVVVCGAVRIWGRKPAAGERGALP